MSTEVPDMWERNRRILRHEAETPMDGHDADGRCCLRAQLTPTSDETTQPAVSGDVGAEVAAVLAEVCPSDGQSVAWHRHQDDPGARTNGEFIGCDWGTDHIWMPPHHLVGLDLGMRCTECGGHTAVTPPCIPGRWVALSKETSDPGPRP